MKKINKDFIYNIIYQVFTFIIPLITVPYVSRIFGAENVGTYSYSYSIVYYFMLVVLLGINNYGAKRIAQRHNDKKGLSEEFWSIYKLQLINGLAMLLAYNLFITFFINSNKHIFYLQNFFLVSAILDVNWFFFGLERFKLTISRNIIIKLVSLALIFILVKTPEDLWKYTFIMSFSTLLSQLYLWIFIKKEVKYAKTSKRYIFQHLKPCLLYFIPVISYSIYRVMDKTMLGSMASMSDLGFYENSEKIVNIPVGILSALGTVMLPNMSKIVDRREMNVRIQENSKTCFFLLCPILVGIFGISKDFSLLFFGEEFSICGDIIRVLLISVIFAGIANIIRTNYLIPRGKDKIYVNSTIFGAIINLIANLVLIPLMGVYGACVGTICAEFSVMIYQVICVRKEPFLQNVIIELLLYLCKSATMLIPIITIGVLVDNLYARIILQIMVAALLYLLINRKYIINEFLCLKRSKKTLEK